MVATSILLFLALLIGYWGVVALGFDAYPWTVCVPWIASYVLGTYVWVAFPKARDVLRKRRHIARVMEWPASTMVNIESTLNTLSIMATNEPVWLPIYQALNTLCGDWARGTLTLLYQDMLRLKEIEQIMRSRLEKSQGYTVAVSDPDTPKAAHERLRNRAQLFIRIEDAVNAIRKQVVGTAPSAPMLVASVRDDAMTRMRALRNELVAIYPNTPELPQSFGNAPEHATSAVAPCAEHAG